jgi:hypothetical protein
MVAKVGRRMAQVRMCSSLPVVFLPGDAFRIRSEMPRDLVRSQGKEPGAMSGSALPIEQ